MKLVKRFEVEVVVAAFKSLQRPLEVELAANTLKRVILDKEMIHM